MNTKLKPAVTAYLEGKGYFKALEAMRLAEKYHTGLRKDLITAEFNHQICMAAYSRTLSIPAEIDEDVYVAIFLHDLVEDYKVPKELFPYHSMFEVSEVLSKTGETTEKYYNRLCEYLVASIVKGIDRSHNLSSMISVFSQEKQQKYITETRDYVIPMLKNARQNFPQYVNVFYNLKHVLLLQVELWEGLSQTSQKKA